MIDQNVKQSPIFSEFSAEDAVKYFDFKRQAVVPHVDTFYYSVFVRDDTNSCSDEMQAMLDLLKGLKNKKALNYSAYVDFMGLSVENTRFATYEYCLSYNESFDIFVASYLPNDFTPRIVVQLRTRSLVLDGYNQAICKSYRILEKILWMYGLEIDRVQENRVDYAWHTNLIQSPYKFFSDDMLLHKLKSKMRLYHKVGNIGKKIDIDYLSIGQRKSNDIFVRIYNKSREVIEKNYKSFFLDKWLHDGLINGYDYYCYQKAYELHSYVCGLLVGRIDWYLEYGTDETIKAELMKVKQSCYVNSDNAEHMRDVVDKYLPPVTLVMNIEFQTKRKFYSSLDHWIGQFGNTQKDECGNAEFIDPSFDPIQRLFVISSLRSEICKYLTENTVVFVDDKGTKSEKMSYWWQRIHDATIDDYGVDCLKLWRDHERMSDISKAKRKTLGNVATLSILKSKDFEKEHTFNEDVSDLLCYLNDNDFYGFANDPNTGKPSELSSKEYGSIRARKVRQWKPILRKNLRNIGVNEDES